MTGWNLPDGWTQDKIDERQDWQAQQAEKARDKPCIYCGGEREDLRFDNCRGCYNSELRYLEQRLGHEE